MRNPAWLPAIPPAGRAPRRCGAGVRGSSAGTERRGGNRRARAGFSLIEVLVALAIFVFGITALLGLMNLAAKQQKDAADETERALIAEAVFAELEAHFDRYLDRDGDGFPDVLAGAKNANAFRAAVARLPGLSAARHWYLVHYDLLGAPRGAQGRAEVLVTVLFPKVGAPAYDGLAARYRAALSAWEAGLASAPDYPADLFRAVLLVDAGAPADD